MGRYLFVEAQLFPLLLECVGANLIVVLCIALPGESLSGLI